MFPCRVPMVVRAWFCPPRSYDLFVDLYNVVRHAADGIVELMGLIHHGHTTCGWSRMGVSAMVRGPVRGLVRHAAVGVVDLNGLIHHGHMTCVWSRMGVSAMVLGPVRGLVRHAADGIVDLNGLIHHGNMTCVCSVGPCRPRRRRDRGMVSHCPPRRRRDRGLMLKGTPKSYIYKLFLPPWAL